MCVRVQPNQGARLFSILASRMGAADPFSLLEWAPPSCTMKLNDPLRAPGTGGVDPRTNGHSSGSVVKSSG
jgi:hypothetical protein